MLGDSSIGSRTCRLEQSAWFNMVSRVHTLSGGWLRHAQLITNSTKTTTIFLTLLNIFVDLWNTVHSAVAFRDRTCTVSRRNFTVLLGTMMPKIAGITRYIRYYFRIYSVGSYCTFSEMLRNRTGYSSETVCQPH
jgi:hypothetical protein